MSFHDTLFLACLPAVVLASWALHARPRLQNLLLLAFSLVFYGSFGWKPLLLLAISILVDYAIGLRIAGAEAPAARRGWLGVSLAANLGLLAVFKYANFALNTAFDTFQWMGVPCRQVLLDVALPAGISFYTFQSLAYTIDVYRREVAPARSLLDYALYVSFFPQLVAGPIERAGRLLPQISAPKRPRPGQFREGAYLVLYGLFQKTAVADPSGSLADFVFAHPDGHWLMLLLGTLAFSLQIYGDFAGYSNIARGCARLLGVELMANFAWPYFSTSITEFWRRWHISLSTWLRDYLYVPLGGNRLGTARNYANLLIVMFLGGLWHGASWTFVAWGGLHGVYLAVHKALRKRAPPGPTRGLEAAWKGAATFLLVSLSWVFFRSATLSGALDYLAGLAMLRQGPLGHGMLLQFGLILLFALPLEILGRSTGDDLRPLAWPWMARGPLYLFLVWSILGGLDADRPFLYFRF